MNIVQLQSTIYASTEYDLDLQLKMIGNCAQLYWKIPFTIEMSILLLHCYFDLQI